MSEPIPESVPTSADPRSRRPIKRARTGASNTTATAAQADEIENLMWDPSRPVNLPAPSSSSDTKKSSLAAPPEIVANVQGSSAGAGSGEFHVYKASRRREYERLRAMDEQAQGEEDDQKWKQKEMDRREKDEEKTRKNREKRNKKKNKKGGQKSGGQDNGGKMNGQKTNGAVKKNVNVPTGRKGEDDDEAGTAGAGSDFALAEIAKETGITIHDDD